MIAKNPAPFIGEWPLPHRRGRPFSRTYHESQKQLYTPAELEYQARMLAWCDEHFPEIEADLENIHVPKSQKSNICACNHAWPDHRTDGSDAADSACFHVEGARTSCPCGRFTVQKNSSVEAQGETSRVTPCADTSKSTERRTAKKRGYRVVYGMP